MTTIAVVGDPHALPGYDNDRFEWLGKWLAVTRPNKIVVMGDWIDLPSLCKHNSKKAMEGMRVKADIAAAHDSLERLHAPLDQHNRIMRERKKGRYRPELHYILGNHEARLDQLGDEHPQLEGILDEALQPWWKRGWNVWNFKDVLSLHGFAFSHFLPSGTMGRPVGGASGSKLANALLLKGHQSAIVGHDHRFGHAKEERWDGGKIHGFTAGCYGHPDYNESWCRNTVHKWDRGVLLLRGVEDGDLASFEWVTQDHLRRKYG